MVKKSTFDTEAALRAIATAGEAAADVSQAVREGKQVCSTQESYEFLLAQLAMAARDITQALVAVNGQARRQRTARKLEEIDV
jgi:hypothetical protein